MRTQSPSTQQQAFTKALALELMDEHGLLENGWSFCFNDNRSTLGLCKYVPKVIELSVHFVDGARMYDVRDIILHEIAHALVGWEAGHGTKWKQKAIQIGGTGNRCGNMNAPFKFRGECSEHYHSSNRRNVHFCSDCESPIVWEKIS
jgi:predicted SprT family Zn-dependent metalloprotease